MQTKGMLGTVTFLIMLYELRNLEPDSVYDVDIICRHCGVDGVYNTRDKRFYWENEKCKHEPED